MSLRINDTAPDFTADTTEGPISFHDWIGDGWAILFSHPKNFTPVCTTELGYMAGIAPEFAKRGAKILGISVDPVENHHKWKADITQATGHTVGYPLIGDGTLAVAKLYEMLPADAGDTSEGRTPADNATVRSVFIIGPDKKVKLSLTYPMTTGRNFDEILRALELDPAHRQVPGGDARQLEAGRGRDHHRRRLRRGGREALRRLHPRAALPQHHAAAGELRAGAARAPRRPARRGPPPAPGSRRWPGPARAEGSSPSGRGAAGSAAASGRPGARRRLQRAGVDLGRQERPRRVEPGQRHAAAAASTRPVRNPRQKP